MQKRTMLASCAISAVLALNCFAPNAFAAEAPKAFTNDAGTIAQSLVDIRLSEQTLALTTSSHDAALTAKEILNAVAEEAQAAQEALAAKEASEKLLACDPSLLAAIGTQETTGHTICCAAFACAYGDAIAKGMANDHSYYGCACCTWPGWGGGNSSFRNLGSSQSLLREAYEQIKAGKPTVVHVAASYGEHWVTLVGYQNVTDPNSLAFDNFVCIDPWDGAQITATERFSLYGDNCQHIAE